MVTQYLFFIVFALAVVYGIFGSILSHRLSHHIHYEGGFLRLWNLVQFHTLVSGEFDFELLDEKAKKYFHNLNNFILYFYAVFIPLLVITFFSNFFVGDGMS